MSPRPCQRGFKVPSEMAAVSFVHYCQNRSFFFTDLLEIRRQGPREGVVDVLADVVGVGALAEVAGEVLRTGAGERVDPVLALAPV